jgi:hypothetical protein
MKTSGGKPKTTSSALHEAVKKQKTDFFCNPHQRISKETPQNASK